TANDVRRHESPEAIAKRAEARRQRVQAARLQGQSTRVIAEAEQVCQTTIQQDMQRLTEQGCSVSPAEQKVTGKDGRRLPATKARSVLCQRCKRVGPERGCAHCHQLRMLARKPDREPGDETGRGPKPAKNGRERFDWKAADAKLGPAVRLPDDI